VNRIGKRTANVLLMGVLLSPLPSLAVEPIRFGGALAGRVTDSAGVPQMGATVFLYNRFERLLERGLTGERGNFLFTDLAPDVYSVRVSLSTYVPALKRIAVQPGMRSFLAISLTSVLSSIELVYAAPGQATAMSEDWKWALRSATSTRPVLRLLPGVDYSGPKERNRSHAALFSDTRGVLRVSAGDGGAVSAAENQPDLGTAFALATSLFGSNHLHFSGNLGYGSASGIPTAGFRGSFSRQSGQVIPEVNVTMRQMFLPARIGMSLATGRGDAPVLKTLAVSTMDRVALADNVELHYGAALESVSFVHRLNFFSPFARLSWSDAELGTLQAAYSSGVPAAEMLIDADDPDSELQHHLSALSLFPRVSLRGGRAHVQRTANLEVGWRKTIAGRTAGVSIYREDLSNAAITMAAPGGYYSMADLLPDISSPSSIFNIGGYRRSGMAATLTQPLGEDLNVTMAWGIGGALEPARGRLDTSNPDELRSSLRRTSRQWLAARVHGTAPRVGTRFSTSYQWTDYRVLNRPHLYLTQRTMPEMGLNIHLRQPIPALNVFSARLEATAELRNLLAEGYVPLSTAEGTRVVLIPSPRAVRGGLSFIF
jgi:hypothetical protein